MSVVQKLTSVILTTSLVLSLIGTAVATDTPTSAAQSACDRMLALKVLKGRTGADACALGDELTRAELVTILVRAFGKEGDSALLKGTAAYSDTSTHWASGAIAMAKNLVASVGSDPIGLPDGTFNPDGKVTPAQAVAFLMKFLGGKPDAGKSWPSSYLDRAVELGIITAADRDGLVTGGSGNTTRGYVFFLFDRTFYGYKLPSGETVYTKYVDPSKPEITLDKIATTVSDPQITISGTVKGAPYVMVGADKVTADANGTFVHSHELIERKTYTITVSATTTAGNTTVQTLTVTRINGDAATVEAKLSAALLKAGATADLTVTVKDKYGEPITNAAFDVKVDGSIGTYANGKLTAADKPATGKITVTAANAKPAVLDVAVVAGDLAAIKVTGPATAKIGQGVTFTAKGYDAKDNEVALKDVQWSSSTGGVISPAGDFAGTASGSMLVTVKAGGKEGTAIVTVFGDAKALVMDVPTGLVANGVDNKTITVKVVDASGAVVANNATNITLSLDPASKIKLLGPSKPSNLSAAAVNGVATFIVYQPTDLETGTGFTASSASVSVIGGTLTGAVSSIASVAPTVASVALTTDPDAKVVDLATSSVTVKAKVLDTAGVQIPAPAAFTVTVSNSNAAVGALSTTTLYFNAGDATTFGGVALTLKGKEGDVTLSGTTSAGYTVTPATFTTKTAGPAYQMVVVSPPKDNNADSGKFELKVAIQDATGTTKTSLASGSFDFIATAKHENGYTKRSSSAILSSGVVTFTFASTARNALTKAGTWTFTAAAGDLIAPPAVTAKVTPGAFYQLGYLKLDGDTDFGLMVSDGAMKATMSVELQDQHGNLVPNATAAVTFQKATDTDQFWSLPVTNHSTTGVDATGVTVNAVNGVASVPITATIAEGLDLFKVSATKADGSYYANSDQGPDNQNRVAAVLLMVGAPAGLGYSWFDGSMRAGSDLAANFYITDGSNTPWLFAASTRPVVTDNGRPVTVEVIDDSTNTVVKSLTGTSKNGRVTVTFSLTKSGSYTVKASASFNGEIKTTTISDVYVEPADPATAQVTANVSGMEQDSAVTDNIGLLVKDAYGNTINKPDILEFTPVVNNGVPGILTPGANGKWTFTAPAGSPQVYTVSDADGFATVKPRTLRDGIRVPVVGTTVTTYKAGPNYTLGLVEPPATVTAGNPQSIKIGVFDGSGHLKTGVTGLNITLSGDGNNPVPLIPQDKTVVNGVATFNTNELKAGTYVYSATSGELLPVNDVKVVVNPAEANKVLGSTIGLDPNGSSLGLVKFRVTDRYGNTVPSFSGTMKFQVDGGSGATLLNTSAPIVNGVAIAQVQASNMPGTLRISATIDGDKKLDVTAAKSIVVVGMPNKDTSTATWGADKNTIYVMLRDVNGKPVIDWEANLDDLLQGHVFTQIGNGVYAAIAGAYSVEVTTASGTFTLIYPPRPE